MFKIANKPYAHNKLHIKSLQSQSPNTKIKKILPMKIAQNVAGSMDWDNIPSFEIGRIAYKSIYLCYEKVFNSWSKG